MKRKKARGRQAGGQGDGAKRKKTGSRQSRGVRTTSGNLNVVLLFVTLITGIAGWILSKTVYDKLIDSIPRSVLIGCAAAVLTLLLTVLILMVSASGRAANTNIITGSSNTSSIFPFLIIGTLIVFAASSVLQFIYGLETPLSYHNATSYIFLIDDSGSMSGSDENGLRYKAVGEVLESMDDSFPFMVYGFSNETVIMREMGPKSDGIPELSGYANGGTEIKSALTKILEDCRNGVWDGGEAPKVILLSDGEATDFSNVNEIIPLLSEYVEEGITISTVGLIHVDENAMREIANATGGVYISVENAAGLAEAMKNAGTSHSIRDLVSIRYRRRMDGLFGLMRIIFLTIIGIMIGFFKAVAYGDKDSTKLILVSSVAFSILGSLFMELGTGVLGRSSRSMWFILWVLYALTLAYAPKKRRGYGSGDNKGETNAYGKPTSDSNNTSGYFG